MWSGQPNRSLVAEAIELRPGWYWTSDVAKELTLSGWRAAAGGLSPAETPSDVKAVNMTLKESLRSIKDQVTASGCRDMNP
jgi:hypothetical protein